MEILPTIEIPDKRLTTKSEVIEEITPDIKAFAEEMIMVLEARKGLGLAAPQIGRNIRLIVGYLFNTEMIALVNPEIIRKEHGEATMTESCLSCPGKEVDVIRPEVITIIAEDLYGNKLSRMLGGLNARIFQHELDHLDGVLITDYENVNEIM